MSPRATCLALRRLNPICLADMSDWNKKAFNLFVMPTVANRIEHLRRLMLIHSCVYYELNSSLVDDHQWQAWADELTRLQMTHGFEYGFYDSAFFNWDGSTGYHLPLRDPDVIRVARKLEANPHVKRQLQAAVVVRASDEVNLFA